ncbi:GDSL-type esterase/lipase family protein [Stappia sp.]|uniref:SGNH/GDSL hydrolase family protein n=1 Tax=Stappia sp. TaxID=1870903 RepID=UPI0025DD360C|nr:GDSL-type esterase/lipase family protein [Stappia sp.]
MAGAHVLRRTLAAILVVALAICGLTFAAPVLSTPAQAQNGRPIVQPGDSGTSSFHPLSPLLRLFGVEKRGRTRLKERKSERQSRQPREPVKPVIVEVPKEADARVILVVGDALAGELAEGLEATYAEVPSVRVDKLVIDDASLTEPGLTPLDDRLRAVLQGRKVAVVVTLIGSRDVRAIAQGANEAAFRSETWDALYARRIDQLLASARILRTPLVWVGLPPPSGQAKRADFGHVNTLAKARVEANNAIYVDVWDVFLDENGGYTSYGPDVEGKRRRLRDGDGVGFTWHGKRKLAFFAERAVARILGSSGANAFEGVEDDPNFIVLTGRLGSPETELAGGEDARNEPVAETPQYQLIVQGEPLPFAQGRVDDFRDAEAAP